MVNKQGLEDFQDLLQYAKQDIEEKTSVCPNCGKEIDIFIEKHRVSMMCRHCGLAGSQPLTSKEK